MNLEWMTKVLAGILGLGAELFFNTQDLIVFCQTLRSAWCTSFDLTSGEGDDQVGNECVFGFTGSMGDHGSPAVILGVIVSVRNRYVRFLVSI